MPVSLPIPEVGWFSTILYWRQYKPKKPTLYASPRGLGPSEKLYFKMMKKKNNLYRKYPDNSSWCDILRITNSFHSILIFSFCSVIPLFDQLIGSHLGGSHPFTGKISFPFTAAKIWPCRPPPSTKLLDWWGFEIRVHQIGLIVITRVTKWFWQGNIRSALTVLPFIALFLRILRYGILLLLWTVGD